MSHRQDQRLCPKPWLPPCVPEAASPDPTWRRMAHSLLGDPLQVLQESRGTMSLAKWGLGQVGGSGVRSPGLLTALCCPQLVLWVLVPVAVCPCPNTQALHPCSDIITSPTSEVRRAMCSGGCSSHVSAWLPEPCVSCLCSSCVVCVWLYFISVSMFLEGELM